MPKQNVKLSKILNQMAEQDQKFIKRVRETLVFDDIVQRANTERLKEIIEKSGWPSIDLVGKKASRNAGLIIQHADHDVRFQNTIKKKKEVRRTAVYRVCGSKQAYEAVTDKGF